MLHFKPLLNCSQLFWHQLARSLTLKFFSILIPRCGYCIILSLSTVYAFVLINMYKIPIQWTTSPLTNLHSSTCSPQRVQIVHHSLHWKRSRLNKWSVCSQLKWKLNKKWWPQKSSVLSASWVWKQRRLTSHGRLLCVLTLWGLIHGLPWIIFSTYSRGSPLDVFLSAWY